MATPVANPLPEKGDVELTQDLVQQDARPDDTLRGPINSSRSGTKKEKSPYGKLKDPKKKQARKLIFECAENEYKDAFMKLYQRKVPINEKIKQQMSAIHCLVERNHYDILLEVIKHSLSESLSEEKLSKDKWLQLLDNKKMSFEEKLLKVKELPRPKKLEEIAKYGTKLGWRPLHIAIKNGYHEMVQLLLLIQGKKDFPGTRKRHRKKEGDNNSEEIAGGMTPVHIAARSADLEILKYLWAWCGIIREGEENQFGPFSEEDNKGWCVLHFAIAGDPKKLSIQTQKAVLEWLLDDERMKCGLHVEKASKKGHTPLITAAEYKQLELAKLLLEKKANKNATVDDGKMALHFTAIHDYLEMAELLCDKEACLATDKDSNTPLHIASKKHSSEVEEYLRKQCPEADDIENNNGHTPKTIPKEKGEFIPPEIRKRGKEAVRIYKEALRDGKSKIPHVKMVILGEARHGKTSLLRLLENEKFIFDSKSTEGIETDLVSTQSLSNWTKQKPITYSHALAKHVKEVAPDSVQGRNKPETKQRPKEQIEQEINNIFPKPKRPPPSYHQHPKIPDPNVVNPAPYTEIFQLPTPVDTRSSTSKPAPNPDPKKVNPVPKTESNLPKPAPPPDVPKVKPDKDVSTAVQIPKATPSDPPRDPFPASESEAVVPDKGLGRKVQKDINKDFPKLVFTVYDFAGQELYRPMHHCFITQRSVFMIVFNSRIFLDMLNAKDKDSHRHIQYWFNTISAYTKKFEGERGKGRKPPVILVGTHRGPYEKDGEAVFERISEEDEKGIRDQLYDFYVTGDNRKRYISHLLKEPLKERFQFVECSLENEKESGAESLKKVIEETADSLPFMDEEYPMKWLQFQERLQEEPGLRKLEAVEKMAQELGLSKEATVLALQFFHDIGVITVPAELPQVFLSEEERETLKEVVLCGPQLLADIMKELLMFKEKHVDKLDYGDAVLLIQNHILKKCALRDMLPERWSKEDFEHIFLFLKAYNLLFAIEEESGAAEKCLVPSLLKPLEMNPELPKRYFKFYVNFLGYLPPEVFNRFVCLATLESEFNHLRKSRRPPSYITLKADCCGVKGWCEEKDAWVIVKKGEGMSLFVSPSLQVTGKHYTDYIKFATEKLQSLFTDMKLTGILYEVEMEAPCCTEEGGSLILGEYGEETFKDYIDQCQCDSCDAPCDVELLLRKKCPPPKKKKIEVKSPEEIREFLEGKEFSDQLLSFCCFKDLQSYLFTNGVISKEQMEVMSQCKSTKEANSQLFEFLIGDPSIKKLQKLCDVLREHSKSHENNQKLADMIEKFLYYNL